VNDQHWGLVASVARAAERPSAALQLAAQARPQACRARRARAASAAAAAAASSLLAPRLLAFWMPAAALHRAVLAPLAAVQRGPCNTLTTMLPAVLAVYAVACGAALRACVCACVQRLRMHARSSSNPCVWRPARAHRHHALRSTHASCAMTATLRASCTHHDGMSCCCSASAAARPRRTARCVCGQACVSRATAAAVSQSVAAAAQCCEMVPACEQAAAAAARAAADRMSRRPAAAAGATHCRRNTAQALAS
jgi:hypothetical protein